MADSVEAQMTQFLLDIYSAFNTYGSPTVEAERLFSYVNGRYPYIQICGPKVMYPDEFDRIQGTDFLYLLKFYPAITEGPETVPLTWQLKNLNRDMTVVLKNDQTMGGLSQSIDVIESSYDMEIVDDRLEYFHYLNFSVNAIVDDQDLTLFE